MTDDSILSRKTLQKKRKEETVVWNILLGPPANGASEAEHLWFITTQQERWQVKEIINVYNYSSICSADEDKDTLWNK